jgi:DNA polymerase-3 subunit epsilon
MRSLTAMNELLIIDTETTGLTLHPLAPPEQQPHIIEFGGLMLSRKTGKELYRNSWLIKPPIAIPPDSTKVHRITDADVQGAPSFAERWPQIKDKLDAAALVIAHNAPFDFSMLQIELQRLGITYKFPRFVDTIGLFRADFGHDPKLTELYKAIVGTKLAQTHRAMEDVEALTAIVQTAKLGKVL